MQSINDLFATTVQSTHRKVGLNKCIYQYLTTVTYYLLAYFIYNL